MLTLRCAQCKAKLWKYNKLGKGEVVRCHKERITKMYKAIERDGKMFCPCGAVIGHDKGSHWNMVRKSFIYSGQKVSKL